MRPSRPLAAIALATLLVALPFGFGPARAATDAGDMPYGQGVLWQVARGGEAPSFLFGTIHLDNPEILDLPAPVIRAFETARSASFELVYDDASREEVALASVFEDQRQTLDAVIGPELYGEVVDAAEPYGLSLHELRRMRPWLIVMTLSKTPGVYSGQRSGKPFLDTWLQERALERGLPVHGLESVHEQVSVIDDLPAKTQRDMIRELLKARAHSAEELEQRHAERIKLYLDRDIAGIFEQAASDSTPEEAELEALVNERLFDARNRVMVERMIPRLDEGQAFVAIGAGHLPGEAGILALLAQRGYSITRLY